MYYVLINVIMFVSISIKDWDVWISYVWTLQGQIQGKLDLVSGLVRASFFSLPWKTGWEAWASMISQNSPSPDKRIDIHKTTKPVIVRTCTNLKLDS